MRQYLFLFALLIFAFPAAAQDAPVGEAVEIAASNDGHILKATLYYPENAENAPAVLLMHQNNGRRADWNPLIPALVEAGYVALAVDLRGFGETRGTTAFGKAQEDTQDWLAYLQGLDGVDATRTAAIGASIGANLSLVGCAANEACVTAIALSPGLNFFNVEPTPALTTGGLSEKSALLIVSQRDSQSNTAVKQMTTSATGILGVRLYRGSLHGTMMFLTDAASISGAIVSWLDEYLAVPETE